jgi:ADP-ribose pyrophosphatase
MITEEKTIWSEVIYEGTILNLRKDKVTSRDGKTSFREIVEHGGGVAIIAITPQGKAVMVSQYRKAAERVMLEVPAGKMERGEIPYDTAIRELKEETGYTAGRLEHVMDFFVSVGYCTEVIHLYLAEDLSPGETDFDENEDIEISEHTFDELSAMLSGGEITDAKTIIAIQALLLRRSG